MIGTIWQDTITPPFVIMGIIQYPLYGFIIDKAKSDYKRQLMFALIITHLILAGLIIAKSSEYWK